MSNNPPKTLAVVTLGCPKNQVDSEVMAGALHLDGWRTVAEVEQASMVVINTCAFLSSAVEESMETIRSIAALKETGSLRHLIVAGCLPQRVGEELLREVPEVDYLIGTGALGRIVDICRSIEAGCEVRGAVLGGLDRLDIPWSKRAVISGPSAYLKISEGCDRSCSFCIIPDLRGSQRSRSPQEIVEEARRLVGSGVRELILIGQDTTSYGRDLPGSLELVDLLEALQDVEEARWIRILYTHPAGWNDRLIEAHRDLETVLPYIDMPIQHTDDSILKRMQRGVTHARTRDLIHEMRARIPDLTLRTTLLLGFPGETDTIFRGLLEEIDRTPFDRLGVFPYSPEPGSPAALLQGQVPSDVADERCRVVMEKQQSIALSRQQKRLGAVLPILIESVEEGGESGIGRSPGEAPEIDGDVLVRSDKKRPLSVGEIVDAAVVAVGSYDLETERVN
ncbi:MAG: 30S ribosomal protein S12 methylthiotransferase RimO [Candidatus Eisenbacteria bacterium]|uniref:Ribosomal protein uS12 methylthiotransferase RimO n=1 Tax=Eiseniibacteriota bacterium TaxID=2212470 RepID=A0A948RSM4_UNCEI|nr:30S ribosomal protein S12 methylthiotransferase RimO [Candidatus Eisenbacteria bacterium]MBU1950131.1 30S ribosomal protein S12 methylthiotransferase RimO [Candidatus Eisenbacteria bacterium]MBU2689841.1 30S ribosomal protein S12 methylthiotransferase RimO [Candidatus Eisenbacteria bacterium]